MAKLDIQIENKLDVQAETALDIQPDTALDIQQDQQRKPIFQQKTPEGETVGQFSSQFVNTLGFGIPEFIANKAGFQIPEPTTSAGKIASGLGQLGGFIGGPAKLGGKIAGKVLSPLTRFVAKAPTANRLRALTLTQGATRLGIASALMTPKEEFISPIERGKAFGSGALTGSVFGAMSYIPSKAGRMLANSTFLGVPSTLRQEPLEEQIFNYGLGAYFGIKGTDVKKQKEAMLSLQKKIAFGDEVASREGLNAVESDLINRREKLLRRAAEPLPEKRKVKDIIPGKPKIVTLFDRYLRSGYGLLEHIGGGKFTEEGLTSAAHNDAVKREASRQSHYDYTNTFKRAIGLDSERSRDVFNWLDQPKTKGGNKRLVKKHGKATLRVANLTRDYLDVLVDEINIQRVRNGDRPVSKRANYAAHIFDFSKEAQNNIDERFMYQEWFKPSSKQRFVHGMERKGKQGFIRDTWKMLDIYAVRAQKAASDDFIRQGEQYFTYLDSLEKRRANGQRLVDDFNDIDIIKNNKRNVRSFLDDWKGKMTEFDKNFSDSVSAASSWLKGIGVPQGQVDNVNKLSNSLVSLMYTSQLGFRPKLAIRNLGQHSLIIGQTGIKPLLKAMATRDTPEFLEALDKSSVWTSRGKAFVPEAQGLKNITRKSMWMFRQADLKNVKDAFKSGYFQAKGQGKSNAEAIKRGDFVAGTTQFVYLQGNRSGLARGIFGQTTKPLSVFTSWPINYLEFLIQSSSPEHRANLLQYIAASGGIIAVSAALGIKGINFVGANSPMSLFRFLKGELPLTGIAERPRVQVLEDMKKTFKKQDIKEMLFYTLGDSR